jgi:hypothetical protein
LYTLNILKLSNISSSVWHVKVTCYSFFHSIFAGHGPFLVVVLSGDVVVAVVSTGAPGGAAGIRVVELHLPDPLRPAVPAFFN